MHISFHSLSFLNLSFSTPTYLSIYLFIFSFIYNTLSLTSLISLTFIFHFYFGFQFNQHNMDCSSYINTSLDLNITPFRVQQKVPVSINILILLSIYQSLFYTCSCFKCFWLTIFSFFIFRRRRWKTTFSPWGSPTFLSKMRLVWFFT